MGGPVDALEADLNARDDRDLTRRAYEFRALVNRLILDAQCEGGRDPRFRLFAEGIPQIYRRLPHVEQVARHVAYNMQRRMPFDPLSRDRALNERSRSRKLRMNGLSNQMDHPSLAAACHPDVLVGPVYTNGLVVDERFVLLPGPRTPRGESTVWLCHDRDLIMEFCDIWEKTQKRAMPILDVPGLVHLTERQIDVASLLARGAKDATIARLLGVSPRTVTTDIGRLADALGAATRWETAMALGRAAPPDLWKGAPVSVDAHSPTDGSDHQTGAST